MSETRLAAATAADQTHPACGNCGGVIVGRNRPRKFCSYTCFNQCRREKAAARARSQQACSICGNAIAAPVRSGRTRKFCSRHCQGQSRLGGTNQWAGTLSERFWAKVDKNGPVPEHCPELGNCWTWTGSINPVTGYGQFSVSGKSAGAHRAAWEIERGTIPSGMQVLHKCDNRSCVRNSHHFIGSQQDNMRDMATKNRCGRITEAGALDMRHRYAAGGITMQVLADEAGMSASSISNILRGQTWKHVGGPLKQIANHGEMKR